MAINKVVYGQTVLIDLTDSTVTPSDLLEGIVAYDRSGIRIVGTGSGGIDGDDLAYGVSLVGSALVGSAIVS